MNDDCWKYILFNCTFRDILYLRLTCKSINIVIDNDYFWKEKMLNDFNDIHKLENEDWIRYYRRRSINYGQPIILDTNDDLDNLTKIDICKYTILITNIIKCLGHRSVLGFRVEIFILSIDRKAYINDELINHHCGIKDIYRSHHRKKWFFFDERNDLYVMDKKTPILLKSNIIGAIRSYSAEADIYYITKKGTYSLLCVKEKLDNMIHNRPLLAYISRKNFICFIDKKHNFCITDKKTGKTRTRNNFKALQLSFAYDGKILILGTDGFVYWRNIDGKFHNIGIPNVTLLGYNSFVTANGDLYYLDKKKMAQLLSNNIVYVDYFDPIDWHGSYVKKIL